MFSQCKNRESYPFWFEMAPLLLTVALLMVQFFIFKDYTPHVPLVIGICITGMFMALKGRKWAGMEQHMYRVMKVALPTTVIILCVGMMIAASIAAGTVQTVLVYGLSILKPTVFLPATCILTTVVSLATGTSWGTVGTVGLAMVGIGEALGVPMHWTVGAICSGAFFGDKMSPLSDTTNLSPAVAGTDIWAHIKAMLPNTIPAYAITIVVYTLVSLNYVGALPWWVTIVICIREFGITLWRMVQLRRGRVVPASRGGKIKTTLQAVAVAFYLVPLPDWMNVPKYAVMGAAVLVTVVTGVQYLLDSRNTNASHV